MHYETVFKPLPDGTHNFDDAMDLVDQLRSNDAYARSIADNGLAFARTHLIKVILVQGQDETSQLLTHLNDELKADVVRNLLIWQCLEQGVRQSTGTASHICLHAFNHSRLRLCTCNTQEVAFVYLQQCLCTCNSRLRLCTCNSAGVPATLGCACVPATHSRLRLCTCNSACVPATHSRLRLCTCNSACVPATHRRLRLCTCNSACVPATHRRLRLCTCNSCSWPTRTCFKTWMSI